MINTKKSVSIIAGIAIFAGIIISAVPFVSSMSPTDAAKENAKFKIKLSDIQSNSPIEGDWGFYKVFIVKDPDVSVFLMPYWEEAYRLPDPTWERAYIPCEHFDIDSDGFRCIDAKLHENWRENAMWDIRGHTVSEWMPDLIKASYKIEGGYLVLNP